MKKATVNKDKLQDLIKSADKINSNDAVKKAITDPGSLKTAYQKAQNTVNSKTATQDQVNDAYQELADSLDQVKISNDAANKAIKEAEDILGKAQVDKSVKDKAQKAIDAAKKEAANNVLPNYADIQKIPDQMKQVIDDLENGTTMNDSTRLEELNSAIKDAEEILNLPADQIKGSGPLKTALDNAKDTLAAAKKGNANVGQIQKAIDGINNAIKGVSINTDALKQNIEKVKAAAKKVYMTKDQEDKLNDELAKLAKTADDTKLASWNDFKKANDAIDTINKDLATLPNETDGKALNDAITNANKLLDSVKGHETQLFDNVSGLQTALEKAEKVMADLKKDPQNGGTNEATTELTSKAVTDETKALNDALHAVTVNKENTTAFVKKAQDAISKLNKDDQATPQAALDAFKDQLKQNHSVIAYQDIIDKAKDVVKTIDDAQNKELSAIIAKVKRIEGTSDANKKYYDTTTYDAMNKELTQAEEAAKLTVPNITTKTMDAKQTAITALEKDVTDLKIAHWEYTENDDAVTLTKYIPNDLKQSPKAKGQYHDDQIEVPAMLKDKQTNLNLSTDLIPPKSGISNKQVTVTFIPVDGKKVQAGPYMEGAFRGLGEVDVTGLDTSKTVNMQRMFDTSYGTSIKGLENLDVSNVKYMNFTFNSSEETELDFSGWKLRSDVSKLGMFYTNNSLKKVTLPDDEASAKIIGEALKTASETKSGLTSDVDVFYKGKQVTTIKPSGAAVGGTTGSTSSSK